MHETWFWLGTTALKQLELTSVVSYTLWNKSFNSEKIQPILIPSKIIPVG